MSETEDELVAASPPKSAEQQEIDHLRFEIDMLTRGGVIEVAVRNPSVAEYMKHWEGRAEKAESGLAEAATRIASLTARVSELGTERERFANDWFEFCAAIDVGPDTQEVMAGFIKSVYEARDQAIAALSDMLPENCDLGDDPSGKHRPSFAKCERARSLIPKP